MSFRKDVFAIFLGGFFGAFLAHFAGAFWIVGLLAGGTIGYIARALAEPMRIARAARNAWDFAIDWRPVPDWKEQVRVGLNLGLSVGGIVGVLVGLLFAISGVHIFSSFWFFDYLSHGAVWSTVACLFSIPLSYACGIEQDDRQIFLEMGRDINMFAIHFWIVYFVLLGILWGVVRIPSGTLKSLCFLKWFAIFVHSENFTACGIYAMISAVVIFFYIPNNVLAMLVAAILGAVIGAFARRVVLFVFAEESAQ